MLDLGLKLDGSPAGDLAKLISLLQGSAYSHFLPFIDEKVLIPHDLLQEINILFGEELHVVQGCFVLFYECFDLFLTILDNLFRVIVVIYDIVELDLNGFHYGFNFLLHCFHLSPQV
jgi:hypothetical protein